MSILSPEDEHLLAMVGLCVVECLGVGRVVVDMFGVFIMFPGSHGRLQLDGMVVSMEIADGEKPNRTYRFDLCDRRLAAKMARKIKTSRVYDVSNTD